MGKQSGRRGKGTCEPFVMLEKRLMESKAWLDLKRTPAAMVVYLYLKKQKRNSDCREHIKLPYNDKDNIFSNQTFSLALKKLVSHGFIEIEELGGLEGGASIYRLSDKWEDWDKNNPYLPV